MGTFQIGTLHWLRPAGWPYKFTCILVVCVVMLILHQYAATILSSSDLKNVADKHASHILSHLSYSMNHAFCSTQCQLLVCLNVVTTRKHIIWTQRDHELYDLKYRHRQGIDLSQCVYRIFSFSISWRILVVTPFLPKHQCAFGSRCN